MPDDFTWRDGDRTIRFGRGALDDAPGVGAGRVRKGRELAVRPGPDVRVHRVDAGGGYADEHFPWTRRRGGDVLDCEDLGRAELVDTHGSHGIPPQGTVNVPPDRWPVSL